MLNIVTEYKYKAIDTYLSSLYMWVLNVGLLVMNTEVLSLCDML